jgi:hypothetical protein
MVWFAAGGTHSTTPARHALKKPKNTNTKTHIQCIQTTFSVLPHHALIAAQR